MYKVVFHRLRLQLAAKGETETRYGFSSTDYGELPGSPVPLNVDCGTTGKTAGYLSMTWVGDEQYVKSSQSATARIEVLSMIWVGDGQYVKPGQSVTGQIENGVIGPLTTLRYFPDQRKNCYSFPGVGQGLKILVRAWFYYGNYDGLSSPPTFDLLFNGNNWGTVFLSGDSGSALYEMVYVTKVDEVSVCLARTKPNDVPFINSLEIKKLEKDMYDHMDTDRPLHLSGRYASPSYSYVRYPDDPYDRLWFPFTNYSTTGLSPVRRSSDPSSNLPDRPPAAVLRQAITPSSSLASNMTVPNLITSTSLVPHYVTFYFVEMLANASRSFDIYLDAQQFYSKTIVPGETVLEIPNPNISLSTSSVFSLVRAKGSTLPPLVSAAEFYMVGDAWVVDATDSSDVKALSKFQKSYVQLQPWSGDPCLPIGYAWEWVNCSSDSTPRVTAISIKINVLGKPTSALLEQEIVQHGFSHAEIVQITNNFEKVLSQGGSGNVYYGRLRNGTEVAVKVLNNSLSQGTKEFVAEESFETISGEAIDDNSPQMLGLNYSHSGCYPPIIDRDVKTTNILLNARMEAKVADFGLSKAGQKDDVTPPSTAVASTPGCIDTEYLYSSYGQKGDVTQMSTAVAGTPGYIDPGYYSTSLVTKKSDVYSFGVVLFELITGHSPMFTESGERLHIVEWVSPRLAKGDIHGVADPKLSGQYNVNSMWKVVDIAMSCTSQRHHSRPHMSNVVHQLKQAIELENNYQHRTDTSFTEFQLSSSSPYEFSSSSLSSSSLPPAR
ncbi:probable LRR receptor-like serine/threonine-protein kinase At1g51810 [Nymphaea colorata]|nr:probable LRR receptor-like serine/threonine-protein kinase At1g51810 [Nymphaea colorata]